MDYCEMKKRFENFQAVKKILIESYIISEFKIEKFIKRNLN